MTPRTLFITFACSIFAVATGCATTTQTGESPAEAPTDQAAQPEAKRTMNALGQWKPTLDDLVTEFGLTDNQKEKVRTACNNYKDEWFASLKLDLGDGSSLADNLIADIPSGFGAAWATLFERLKEKMPGSEKTFYQHWGHLQQSLLSALDKDLNEEQMNGLRAGNIVWQEVATGYDPFGTYVRVELAKQSRDPTGRLHTDIDTLAEKAGLDASQKEFTRAACNELKDGFLKAMRVKRADGSSPLQDLILEQASGTPSGRAWSNSMKTWVNRMPGTDQTYWQHFGALEKALLTSLGDRLTQEQMKTLFKLNIAWLEVGTGYDPIGAQLDRDFGKYDRMPDGKWAPKLEDLATTLNLTEDQKQATLVACNALKDERTALQNLDLGEGSSMLDLFASDLAAGPSMPEVMKKHIQRLSNTVPGSTQTFREQFAVLHQAFILKLSKSLSQEQMKQAQELNVGWFFVETGYNPWRDSLHQRLVQN